MPICSAKHSDKKAQAGCKITFYNLPAATLSICIICRKHRNLLFSLFYIVPEIQYSFEIFFCNSTVLLRFRLVF